MVGTLNPTNVDRCLRVTTLPVVKVGYYTGSASAYQVLAQWTIVNVGYVDEIDVAAIGEDYAQFKLVIGSTTVFTDVKTVGSIGVHLGGKVKLAAGTIVTLYVKSDGTNVIKANGIIVGRDVNDNC